MTLLQKGLLTAKHATPAWFAQANHGWCQGERKDFWRSRAQKFELLKWALKNSFAYFVSFRHVAPSSHSQCKPLWWKRFLQWTHELVRIL